MTRVWRVVACVGLLAVIAVVQRVAPGPAEQYAPITTAGGLGSQVRTEEFVVRAERVAFARAVQFKDELGFVGEPMTTPGVWMVVWATAAATSEALRLQGVEVETAEGSVYAASDALGTLDKVELQPGMPVHGPLLFEVPPQAVAGVTLKVFTQGQRGLRWLGGGTSIDLGVKGTPAPAPALVIGGTREL